MVFILRRKYTYKHSVGIANIPRGYYINLPVCEILLSNWLEWDEKIFFSQSRNAIRSTGIIRSLVYNTRPSSYIYIIWVSIYSVVIRSCFQSV